MQQLQVHLKNKQFVVFNSNDSLSLQCTFDECSDTQLMAFFKANQTYTEAQELLYANFPSKFTWHADDHKWKPRKTKTMYGRMAFVPAMAGEKYYT